MGRSVSQFISIPCIINDTSIQTFIDTGSTTSIVSHNFASRIGLTPAPNSSISISQVEGETKSIGRCSFTLTLGYITHHITAHIIKGFQHDLLIGLDAANKFNLNIDCKNKKVFLGSPTDPHATILMASDQKPITPGPSSPEIELNSLLDQFKDIFAKNNGDVGSVPNTFHEIILEPGSAPKYFNPRPYPRHTADIIRQKVRELLSLNFIRKSKSAYGCTVSIVDKKNGEPRLVCDYRELNNMTTDHGRFPLPQIQTVVDRLHNAKFFSTLDVAWGYHHIKMAPDSIDKTAFNTEDGHFEWLVCPFGLKGAPFTFQRVMREIIGDSAYRIAINYLDDIVVYTASDDFHDHLTHLKEIFLKLRSNNIKLRMKKCTFLSSHVEYLGCIITNNTVKPNPRKVEAVSNFPEPKTRKQIQRFLGLTGYFRRFIPSYTEITYPLSRLLRKNTPLVIDNSVKEAIIQLKTLMTTEPILCIFDPDLDCELHTDASQVGIGSLLMQRGTDGSPRLNACYSKRLSKEQENWSTTDLEGFAVVESIEKFDHYLRNNRFTVFTDHSALQWIQNSSKLKGRLHRWFIRLSPYTFTIEYRKGKSQEHVDALSRAPLDPPDISDAPPKPPRIIDNRIQHESYASHPTPLSLDNLKSAQASSDLSFIKNPIIKDDIVYIKRKGITRAVVPSCLKRIILHFYHDSYGHPGIQKTKQLIKAYYYWPAMTKDILEYVSSCDACQIVKPVHHSSVHGEMQLMPTPDAPLELLSMDTSVMGNDAVETAAKYIQCIIDHHSRYVWAFPTKTNTASAAVNSVKTIITAVGIPKQLLTDQGSNFMSKAFKLFLKNHNIKHLRTSGYHPETNGMIERAQKTIKERLSIAVNLNPKRKWSTLITDVLYQYNNTPHSVTLYPPVFLQFGRYPPSTFERPTDDLMTARKLAITRTKEHQLKHKENHDRKFGSVDFSVGQKVLRIVPKNHPDYSKLSAKQTGPHIVLEKTGPVNYRIERYPRDIKPPVVHASQLVPFKDRSSSKLTF